jgi:hypothetical protein
MLRASSTLIPILAVLFVATRPAPAQVQFIGPGSTPGGDMLRGGGVYLQGLGYYNYNTAVANSINVDTYIKLNEYVWSCLKNENRENARKYAIYEAARKENYNKILERIKNDPNLVDFQRGDAINALLDQLIDPKNIPPSTMRFSPVALNAEVVRSIPFFRADKAKTFSMRRLTSGGNWPIRLRDPGFTPLRKAYERAFEHALEQQLEGRTSTTAIRQVQLAIKELRAHLTSSNDTLWTEAHLHLKNLEDGAEQLQIVEIERVIGALDNYDGATVEDLLKFMHDNKLRFGVPQPGAELELYRSLFASLKVQLKLVTDHEMVPKDGK